MEFTLFQSLIQSIDPHLALQLIEFHEKQEEKIFQEDLFQKTKLSILSKTKIIDMITTEIAKSKDKNALEKLKAELEQVKTSTEKNVAKYQHFAQPFLTLLENNQETLQQQKFVKQAFIQIPEFASITKEALDNSYKFSRTMFDIGQYVASYNVLKGLQGLYEDNLDYQISILWGKFICEMLFELRNDAKETFKLIKQKIDISKFDYYVQQVHQRSQLLHTALFLYLNNPEQTDQDLESFNELFTQEHYQNTILMVSPHLLRYLLASCLLLKQQNKLSNQLQYFYFKSLIQLRVIFTKFTDYLTRGVNQITDKLLIFFKQILINFDFDSAKITIKELSQDFKFDFFLNKYKDQLIQSCYTLVFETYCKIYSSVNMKLRNQYQQNELFFRFISEYVGITEEEAEVWIVNVLRNANIQAKIDSERGEVNILKQEHNFAFQINNRLKDLLPKSTMLINNIKKVKQQQIEKN